MPIDQPAFFRFQKKLLEDLFRKETLESPKSRHPAAIRWRLCQKILRHGSVIRWPDWGDEMQLLAATLLDGATFATIGSLSDQIRSIDLSEYGDQAVQTKIKSRINDPQQFEELMVELSLAAWHKREGHRVTPLEKDNWPDLAVEIEGFESPLFLECKRIRSASAERIAKHIQKANKQLKQVGAISRYRVVLLDVSAALKLGVGPVTDSVPDVILELLTVVRNAIGGPKNRSVSKVILVWDDAGIIGEPPNRTAVFMRRHATFVDHEPVAGVSVIPPNLPLFQGTTIELMLQWDTSNVGVNTVQGTDLLKNCYSWFSFTNEEIIDAFSNRDKWRAITIAPDSQWILFAKRTIFRDRRSNILALSQRSETTLVVQFAIRIPVTLYDDMDLLTPLEMLQRLIDAYGLAVTVGDVTARFVVQHSLQVSDISNPASLIHVHNPSGNDFLLSSFMRVNPITAGFAVDFRLVFALDQKRLLADLR